MSKTAINTTVWELVCDECKSEKQFITIREATDLEWQITEDSTICPTCYYKKVWEEKNESKVRIENQYYCSERCPFINSELNFCKKYEEELRMNVLRSQPLRCIKCVFSERPG